MSRHTDPFYTAKLHSSAAVADIASFVERSKSYLTPNNFPIVSHRDHETGHFVYGIRVNRPIPDDLERDAMRLATEMRSALDKATNAASKVVQPDSGKYTNFPFSESEAAFRGQLGSKKGLFRDIPDALHPYLIGLKPFPEGNRLLHAFLRFSNPAKHDSYLTIDVQANGFMPYQGNFSIAKFGAVWNEAKDQCDLLWTNGPIQGNFGVPIQIIFNDPEFDRPTPFLSTLRDLASMVEGIVSGIEAETARLTNG